MLVPSRVPDRRSARPLVARLAGGLGLALLGLGPGAAAAPGAAAPNTDVCGPIEADTTWTAAASPYRSTCDVEVAAGATLRVEAGAEVLLYAGHRILVDGRLVVAGSADAPASFGPQDAQGWGSVQLLPGSGPHEIRGAVFKGGGQARGEMLGIETGDALVAESRFLDAAGVGLEVRGAVAPRIQDNLFRRATAPNARPPAALRVRQDAAPRLVGNRFESNEGFGLFTDADSAPELLANAFEFNAVDGGLVYGDVEGEARLPSLGSPDWAWHVRGSGIEVLETGRLSIDPGVVLRFGSGTGLKVRGTLRARGTAARPILLSTENDVLQPGQWAELAFLPESAPWDPDSGEGSVVEHARLEYGGFNTDGALVITNASPRIAATTVTRSQHRGITVSGPQAAPLLVGLTVSENRTEEQGIGLLARSGATPSISFSTFQDNWAGVHVEDEARPMLTPHNRFLGNQTFAVRHERPESCVEAQLNDWGAADGPRDSSERGEPCGLGSWEGSGQLVSDGVGYLPFSGQLAPPWIDSPRCGSTADARPAISGFAPRGSTVIIYDDYLEIGRVPTSEEGEGPFAAFSLIPDVPLAEGAHWLQAAAVRGEEASGLEGGLALELRPEQMVAPEGIVMRQRLEGVRYVQPYADASGCALLAGDASWQIRAHPGEPISVELPIACPAGAPDAALRYGGERYPLAALGPGGDDLYAASLPLGEGGPLFLELDCGGEASELALATVNVALNGFVFERDAAGGFGPRIGGATVTLFVFDAALNNFIAWDGAAWYGQDNPQVTGPTGWYGFYPPPGRYRARVEAPDREPLISGVVEIDTQPFMINLGYPAPGGTIYLPSLAR